MAKNPVKYAPDAELQKDDIIQPKAHKAPADKMAPKYAQNMFQPSVMKLYSIYSNSGRLKQSIIRHRLQAAKNFPITIENKDSGCVNKNSMVPDFLSSAHKRMVSAGTKNKKMIF